MNKNTGFYCHWAENGLALHNSGGALVCCHSRTFLKDSDNKQIFWHTHTLKDAWDSPTRLEIQKDLEQGIQHPNCSACWDEENVGITSRRQHHNRLGLIEFKEINAPLLLDLKLGNICNLSCRTCNPYVSSQWTKDWWKVFEIKNNRFDSYEDYFQQTFGNGRLSYDKDNNALWEQLDQWFPHAQYVDIYGAEPMLIHKLFDILKHSVDQGTAANQTLHFNTNGTIWNQEYIDILSKFKQVYIDVSIDGLYNHFDYIRHGETWAVIKENIDRYKQFSIDFEQHCLNSCVTISIFNIFYLEEIFEYLDSYFMVNFNLAHMPYHVNIKILPAEIKKLITEKYTNSNNENFKQKVDPILSYMNEPLSQDTIKNHYKKEFDVWSEFIRSTWELDQLRSQNFSTTFPEFYELLKPYLNQVWE